MQTFTLTSDNNLDGGNKFVTICDVSNVTIVVDGYPLYVVKGDIGCFKIYKLSRIYHIQGNRITFLRITKSNAPNSTLYSLNSKYHTTVNEIDIRGYDIISVVATLIEVIRRLTALETEKL